MEKNRATPAGIRRIRVAPPYRAAVSRGLLIKILVIRGGARARARISDPFEIESKGGSRREVEEDRTNEIVMQIKWRYKQKLRR